MELVLLASLLTPAGLVCLVVGSILFLCEQSWDKRPGSMGSHRFLCLGVVLNLPLILMLIPWAVIFRF